MRSTWGYFEPKWGRIIFSIVLFILGFCEIQGFRAFTESAAPGETPVSPGTSGGPLPNQPVSRSLPLLTLTIHPVKTVYFLKEGFPIQFILKANDSVRLCLEKEPLSQFQIQLSRGGKGKLSLEPFVMKDTRELYFQKIKLLSLKPGQTYTYRTNLKHLRFTNGGRWLPGEYFISATFNLCDQSGGFTYDSSGWDTPIPAQQGARFMVLE